MSICLLVSVVVCEGGPARSSGSHTGLHVLGNRAVHDLPRGKGTHHGQPEHSCCRCVVAVTGRWVASRQVQPDPPEILGRHAVEGAFYST